MSKVNSRPFMPCGSFELKKHATAKVKSLNEDNSGMVWKVYSTKFSNGRYAIIRSK